MNGLARILVGLVTGFLGSRFAWLLLRNMFSTPVFQRENYRSRSVATAGGLCLVLSVLVVEAGRQIASLFGVGDEGSPARMLTMLLVFTFALFGLVDDVAGTGNDRGFRGHLRAFRYGSLTTGGLKLIGGATFSLVAVGLANGLLPGRDKSIGSLLFDAAIIALAANTANLFDRAPGRTTKVSVVSFLLLAAGIVLWGTGTEGLVAIVPVAVVVGSCLGIFHDELRERVMLGDTGANVIGAALGFGVVISASTSARMAVCLVLVGLNLASEFMSFSRVIGSVGPLRWLDSLGRAERAGRETTPARQTNPH